MKRYVFLFLISIMAQFSFGQGSDTIVPPIAVRLSLGSNIPTDNLQSKFSSGVRFGMEYSFKLNDEYKIGLGGEVTIPLGKKSFDFVMPDSVYQAKASALVNVFFKFTQYNVVNVNHIWEKYVCIGGSFLSTDTYDPYYSDVFGESNFGTSGMCFMVGVSYQYRINYKYKVGVNAEYSLQPFAAFEDYLRPDFGFQMFRLGLTFDFEYYPW